MQARQEDSVTVKTAAGLLLAILGGAIILNVVTFYINKYQLEASVQEMRDSIIELKKDVKYISVRVNNENKWLLYNYRSRRYFKKVNTLYKLSSQIFI